MSIIIRLVTTSCCVESLIDNFGFKLLSRFSPPQDSAPIRETNLGLEKLMMLFRGWFGLGKQANQAWRHETLSYPLATLSQTKWKLITMCFIQEWNIELAQRHIDPTL